MAKQEAKVDLWVAKQLDEAGITDYDPQGSDVLELNEVLKTASKTGKGGPGYPEYVAVVKDFVIVIEDKSDQDFHVKLNDDGVVELSDIKAVRDYAGECPFLCVRGLGLQVIRESVGVRHG